MYACAIPPLDQTTTGLGWSPGDYRRDPCSTFETCAWQDYGLQFLADPGTPVVAPFPVTVLSTSPFVVRPTIDLGSFFLTPPSIKIDGVVPSAGPGAVDRGALLGRIGPSSRGTRWTLWAPNAFGVPAQQQFIVQVFRVVGLDIVGAGPKDVPGFSATPQFGGKLLVRANGPADCPPPALHGLGAYFFGSAAGYVDTPSSVYSRYGMSSQSDASAPPPRAPENVTRVAVEAGGGGLAIAAVAALGLWWVTR